MSNNNNNINSSGEKLFDDSDYIGRDTSAPRPRNANNNNYPPTNAAYADDAFNEGGKYPVTRGSIAAQMAAEGQIPKNAGLKMFRTDEHKGALMKGGRAKCCLRVCGCSLLLALIIVVSAIAAFLRACLFLFPFKQSTSDRSPVFARPPDVSFNGIEAPSTGSIVAVQSNGFNLNFQLNVRLSALCSLTSADTRTDWRHQPQLSVFRLPPKLHYADVLFEPVFGASFREIRADAYYSAAPTTKIGGGQLDDVRIPKYSNSTVHFPFALNYTTSIDPSQTILKDIATKCGFLGSGSKQDLDVNYKITLGIRVVGIVVSPSFSSSATFACPLSESDISGLLGGSLSSLTNGGGRERLRERRDQIEKRIDAMSSQEAHELVKKALTPMFENVPHFAVARS